MTETINAFDVVKNGQRSIALITYVTSNQVNCVLMLWRAAPKHGVQPDYSTSKISLRQHHSTSNISLCQHHTKRISISKC